MGWLDKLLGKGKDLRPDEPRLSDEGKPVKGHAASPGRQCPNCGKKREMTAANQCVFCGHAF